MKLKFKGQPHLMEFHDGETHFHDGETKEVGNTKAAYLLKEFSDFFSKPVKRRGGESKGYARPPVDREIKTATTK